MTFDQINPKTGKVKEYKNKAEWVRDVEEYSYKPQEKKSEVKTYVDAVRRLNEELGIRDPVSEKAAADAEFARKVAEGVAAALEKAKKTETAQQAEKAGKANQSPFAFTVSHAAKPQYKFFDGQKCGCKAEGHKPKSEPVIHSMRGVGPTMTARALTAAEAEIRLKQAGTKL